MEIGRKIYYDKTTGNVIQDTGERAGSVVETTQEQDFEAYAALAERAPETVGVKQLTYGEYAQDFMQCNGYRINPVTGTIEFSYPDPNVPPPEPPAYRAPLTVEIDQLKAANEHMKSENADTTALLLELYEAVYPA